MKRALALLLLLTACSQSVVVHGTTDDGLTLSGRIEDEAFIISLPKGVDCRTFLTPKQWRSGLRSAPMECTDGRTGTADFVKDSVAMVGGTITQVIAFRLNDGTRGRASFIIDNFSI